MKYFTREWCEGEKSEEEARQTIDAYYKYVEKIYPHLPKVCRELTGELLNLHDGLIRHITYDSRLKQLDINLRCGDLQIGYFDLDLKYSGVSLEPSVFETFDKVANNPETKLLYDEVDTESSDRFIHRIIFWPEHEVSISFTDISYNRTNKPDRDIPHELRRFTVKP